MSLNRKMKQTRNKNGVFVDPMEVEYLHASPVALCVV